MSKRANLSISIELFRRLLGLPYSVDLVASRVDAERKEIVLTVAHPVLPDVDEGVSLPSYTVSTYSDACARWGRVQVVKGVITIDRAELVVFEASLARLE